MYNTLTLVDNQAVSRLPDYINPVIQELVQYSSKKTDTSGILDYRYFGEAQCDFFSLLESIVNTTPMPSGSLATLKNFIANELVIEHDTRGRLALRPSIYDNKARIEEQIDHLKDFCGLGLLMPHSLAYPKRVVLKL